MLSRFLNLVRSDLVTDSDWANVFLIDGTERQAIKNTDSNNNPRSKIRACSICDPFILVIREDDTIGLFVGESERGKIRRKDMSPMGDKVCFDQSYAPLAYRKPQSSRYLAGCFFNDTTGAFQTRQNSNIVINSNSAPKTSTLANVASGNSQWLTLCRPQGVMEVNGLLQIFELKLMSNRFGLYPN